MRDKLVLRFLGFLETMKYILEQSHGVPPVSVALDHTTLKEEGSCGSSSVKTVRSIAMIHTFILMGSVPENTRLGVLGDIIRSVKIWWRSFRVTAFLPTSSASR